MSSVCVGGYPRQRADLTRHCSTKWTGVVHVLISRAHGWHPLSVPLPRGRFWRSAIFVVRDIRFSGWSVDVGGGGRAKGRPTWPRNIISIRKFALHPLDLSPPCRWAYLRRTTITRMLHALFLPSVGRLLDRNGISVFLEEIESERWSTSWMI